MNKTLVTLSLVVVALLAGVIYLHIYNIQNDAPLPTLVGDSNVEIPVAENIQVEGMEENSDEIEVEPVVEESEVEVDEPEEIIEEPGVPFGPLAILGANGFDPQELIVGEGSIFIRNTTGAAVLIAQSGIDCADTPGQCELISASGELELNVSESTTFTTNTEHNLTVTVQ